MSGYVEGQIHGFKAGDSPQLAPGIYGKADDKAWSIDVTGPGKMPSQQGRWGADVEEDDDDDQGDGAVSQSIFGRFLKLFGK